MFFTFSDIRRQNSTTMIFFPSLFYLLIHLMGTKHALQSNKELNTFKTIGINGVYLILY